MTQEDHSYCLFLYDVVKSIIFKIKRPKSIIVKVLSISITDVILIKP